jgi:hypothetical protein
MNNRKPATSLTVNWQNRCVYCTKKNDGILDQRRVDGFSGARKSVFHLGSTRLSLLASMRQAVA